MKGVLHRLGRRPLGSALALALSLAALGLATSAAHAEPNTGGGTADKHCTYQGLDYSPGAVVNVNVGTKSPPRYIKCDGKTGSWVPGRVVGGQFEPVVAVPGGSLTTAVAP